MPKLAPRAQQEPDAAEYALSALDHVDARAKSITRKRRRQKPHVPSVAQARAEFVKLWGKGEWLHNGESGGVPLDGRRFPPSGAAQRWATLHDLIHRTLYIGADIPPLTAPRGSWLRRTEPINFKQASDGFKKAANGLRDFSAGLADALRALPLTDIPDSCSRTRQRDLLLQWMALAPGVARVLDGAAVSAARRTNKIAANRPADARRKTFRVESEKLGLSDRATAFLEIAIGLETPIDVTGLEKRIQTARTSAKKARSKVAH